MIDETKIMQLADGTLPIEERAEVEEAIKKDPKLEKLFEDYQKTADLLFELGNEIKSTPIPAHIEKKLDSLKETRKIEISQDFIPKIKTFFRFQYVGVAAALAMFFYGGFFTSKVMIAKKADSENQMVAVDEKIDKEIKKMPFSKKDESIHLKKDLNLRELSLDDDENLSDKIAGLYRFIDEKKITEEFNKIQSSLKPGDTFELKVKDAMGRAMQFILVKTFSKDGYNCKTVTYNEKIKLSQNDAGSNVKLDFCKVGENYKLVAINFI